MTILEGLLLLVSATLLLTMPLYAARRRRLQSAARPGSEQGSTGAWLQGWVLWLSGPVERAAVRGAIAPEIFNYASLAFGAAAGAAFAAGALPLAGLLVALSGFCDVLDGQVARARGRVTAFGAFLDSTLDRFVEVFLFVGVAWHLRERPWGGSLAAAALGGSLLVSYARARGQGAGLDVAGGIMQRAERLVLLALAGLLDAPARGRFGWPSGSLLVAALAAITAGSFVTAVVKTATIGRRLRD